MDGVGVAEGAVDHRGPRQEFLQLMMEDLSTKSPIFKGHETYKHESSAD
jgi:hypothetical protein